MTEPEPELRRRPSGRRAGDSGTREAILDAARDLFAERGFEAASVRAIAARAGVDPALIRHFFSDKEKLFASTMATRTVIPERLATALIGDPATLGRRLTDAYLQLWEDADTRPILLGLVRSAMTTEKGAQMLVEALSAQVRDVTPFPNRAAGMVLAGAHLFGVAVARHVLKSPIISEVEHEELVDLVTPAIQRYIDGHSR